jgi:ribosomal protein S12 methylthiotransferase
MKAASPKGKVSLVSLGCPKNQVDAEVMLGRLRREGWEIVATPAEADAVIVNTCAFIDDAKRESIDAILEAGETLDRKGGGRLVVTGCLAQRYAGELARQLPEVAAFVPLGDVAGVAAALDGRPLEPSFPAPYMASFLDDSSAERLLLPTAPGAVVTASAYLKISEGCDHQCSFCAIPSMRGKHRSRPAEDLVAEARSLAARGVKEVVLVSQDSSAYGADRGIKHGLAALLEQLDRVDGIEWVRVMYAYPNTLDDATLRAMASTAATRKYLDMPLQHASERMLKAMKRGGNAASLRKLLDRARGLVPGLVLRTTFIVGFPGESEDDVAELLAFARDVEFQHAGVFTYSHQEGTSAGALYDDVAQQEKDERRAAFMEQQAAISRRLNGARVGATLDVLVEGEHPESEMLLAGRWSGQAPEIDGCVIVTDGDAKPGEIVRVTIEEAHEYDLVGRAPGAAD